MKIQGWKSCDCFSLNILLLAKSKSKHEGVSAGVSNMSAHQAGEESSKCERVHGDLHSTETSSQTSGDVLVIPLARSGECTCQVLGNVSL